MEAVFIKGLGFKGRLRAGRQMRVEFAKSHLGLFSTACQG